MEGKMMNNCVNCKHWSPFGFNGHVPAKAKCKHLNTSPDIYSNNSFIDVDLSGLIPESDLFGIEGEEIFETGANFGCIHFKAK